MRASYLWIRDYLPTYKSSAAKMAEQLTLSGTEIEGIEKAGRDAVFEVGVTSNRADCLCHLGLAREVAAVSGHALEPPPWTVQATLGPTSGAVTVRVLDPDLCPRYTAQVVEGITVGPSPAWLRDRLEAIGLRPVNNVVDVTNFVLLELNQPLHAFDLDRLSGPEIIVRRARSGEILTAINGQECRLTPDDLVIADRDRPVAVAGVMGGLDTEVTERTARILIESAVFDPLSVRRTSRRLQLLSDSSSRFERGVDRSFVLEASDRAARLILETCGGSLRSGPLDAGGHGPAPAPIRLRFARIKTVTGISVPRAKVATVLTALGCATDETEDGLQVTPPSFRADLGREIDLIEEVMRLNGFERLPLRTAMGVRTVPEPRRRALRERLKDRLVALGFLEAVTTEFVTEERWGGVSLLLEGPMLRVKNPVRAGEGALRRSLLPSLLMVRKHNQDAGNENLRLFEIANLHAGPAGSGDGLGPVELPALGWLMDGDYRDARGVAENVLEDLGIESSVEHCSAEALDVSARAQILVQGRRIGYLGHPARNLLKEAGLKVRPVYGELDLAALQDLARQVKKFTELPRFPPVVRDLALIVEELVPYGSVESAIRGLSLEHLESHALFEVYRGPQIGEGRKSLNIRLVFRSSEGTLTSETVDRQMTRLGDRLRQDLGAQVRGVAAE